MKAFNLEEYLKNPSRKVVTKEGKTIKRILCTDARGNYPIVALIEESGYDNALSYTKDGKLYAGETNLYDLYFAPERHEGWGVICGVFSCQSDIYSKRRSRGICETDAIKRFCSNSKNRVGGIVMKKYKPIRIHHINYGYGYWWGNYFFFVGRKATRFAIVPMFMECDKTIYTHNGLSVGRGDTLSWSDSRQRVNAEEVKMPK